MIFTPELIKKYEKKSVAELITIATRVFNAYIRERDKYKPCISSGKFTKLQAGHFYSAGQYPALRFNPDNVHGQALGDNYFKSGNLIEYRKNLLRRIGEERLAALDTIAASGKQNHFKWDRFYLIEVIETYKQKLKTM